jgi:hypothetical protein
MSAPWRVGALALCAAALGAASARAQTPVPAPEDAGPPASAGRTGSRFSVLLGGALAMAHAHFTGERRFTEFAEEGRLDGDYTRGMGPAFELGLEFAPHPRLGVALHFNGISRDSSSSYAADLPHPLYLGQPRQVTGAVDGLSYRERVVHLDLAYRRSRGRLRYGVFAGPSYANVRAELLDTVQYQQEYPFDAVRVTEVTSRVSSASAFGFNVGLELDYRVGGPAAAALLVRYHRVSPDLPDSAGTVELDAGGLQVGAGLRFFF